MVCGPCHYAAHPALASRASPVCSPGRPPPRTLASLQSLFGPASRHSALYERLEPRVVPEPAKPPVVIVVVTQRRGGAGIGADPDLEILHGGAVVPDQRPRVRLVERDVPGRIDRGGDGQALQDVAGAVLEPRPRERRGPPRLRPRLPAGAAAFGG